MCAVCWCTKIPRIERVWIHNKNIGNIWTIIEHKLSPEKKDVHYVWHFIILFLSPLIREKSIANSGGALSTSRFSLSFYVSPTHLRLFSLRRTIEYPDTKRLCMCLACVCMSVSDVRLSGFAIAVVDVLSAKLLENCWRIFIYCRFKCNTFHNKIFWPPEPSRTITYDVLFSSLRVFFFSFACRNMRDVCLCTFCQWMQSNSSAIQ